MGGWSARGEGEGDDEVDTRNERDERLERHERSKRDERDGVSGGGGGDGGEDAGWKRQPRFDAHMEDKVQNGGFEVGAARPADRCKAGMVLGHDVQTEWNCSMVRI